MKKLYSTLMLLCGTLVIHAQNVNYSWTNNLTVGEPVSVKTDAAGNVYTLGFFSGTVDFDPGAGISNLTSAGGSNTFLTKADASGNLLWAKSISGAHQNPLSLVLDASGNPIAVGLFNGTADFDPGTPVNNLNPANGSTFIWKLDASGTFLWVKAIGGNLLPSSIAGTLGQMITTDPSGNLVISGMFNGTRDFDPGAGTANLTAGNGAMGGICL